jgi:hypothetical protein
MCVALGCSVVVVVEGNAFDSDVILALPTCLSSFCANSMFTELSGCLSEEAAAVVDPTSAEAAQAAVVPSAAVVVRFAFSIPTPGNPTK